MMRRMILCLACAVLARAAAAAPFVCVVITGFSDFVKFSGRDESPVVELSVVIPTKDVGGKEITALLATLTNVPIATEIIVGRGRRVSFLWIFGDRGLVSGL